MYLYLDKKINSDDSDNAIRIWLSSSVVRYTHAVYISVVLVGRLFS